MLALAACDPAEPTPPGHCSAAIWAQPHRAASQLTVVGSWDDWDAAAPMRRFDGTWHVAELAVPPGRYGYLVVEEGEGRVDDYNPLSTFRDSDGLEVSLLEVPDCGVPQLAVASTEEGADRVRLVLSASTPIDPASIEVAGPGTAMPSVVDDDELHLDIVGLGPGKHAWDIVVSDADGNASEPRHAVGWVGRRAPAPDDEIVYQVVIDRFRGDDGVALAAPPNPGARAGGTLGGVQAELDAGTFDALGVSTLWLSPVYTNPVEAREGTDGHLYEGYHGYWPVDSRGVDPRIGGEAALRELVAAAHARGIRVVLDLVPNHFYETNPRVAEHAADGWFHVHDPPCVCGTPSCPWSRFIQTCWFTPYLPDLRFQTAGVLDIAVADALWWQAEFDVDGFRIDAVPMMPRAVTRRIVHAVRDGDSTAFHVGEIFTGAGAQGTETIRYYLGPDGLDSAFDFPLMWALRDVVGTGVAGFEQLEASLAYTEAALDGSGSPPSIIIGNHDTTRFISLANGDAGRDPWAETPAAQPTDPQAYDRQFLALGLALTLPGIPTIYYGDEIGLAGGGDPDSRRVFPGELGEQQAALLQRTRTVAQLRRCLPALRGGDRTPLTVGKRAYAFARGGEAVVLVSTATEQSTIALPATAPPGAFVDALGGEVVSIGPGGTQVPMAPLSLRVLVPQGHACVL